MTIDGRLQSVLLLSTTMMITTINEFLESSQPTFISVALNRRQSGEKWVTWRREMGESPLQAATFDTILNFQRRVPSPNPARLVDGKKKTFTAAPQVVEPALVQLSQCKSPHLS